MFGGEDGDFTLNLSSVISNVFDQSHCGGKCAPPSGNHLGQRHRLVNASRHTVAIGGTEVYGR